MSQKRNTSGRKVATWDFLFNDKEVICVDVKMREIDGICDFVAINKDHGLSISDLNVNMLKKNVEERLKELLEVKWESHFWCRFKITKKDTDESYLIESKFSCDKIEIGTSPDNECCWKMNGSKTVYTGHPVDDDDDAIGSLIPVTPENEDGLARMKNQFNRMNENLLESLSQRDIQASVNGLILSATIEEDVASTGPVIEKEEASNAV